MSFSRKKIFAIMPAYNEEKTITEVALKTRKHVGRVVVVDDGSRDDTSGAAEKAGATVLRHTVNLGKGAALKTGCDYAVRKGAELMVLIDSDGQHDPEEIPKLLRVIEGADIVLTYRNIDYHRMPLFKRIGNRFINLNISLLFGIRVIDSQCGYRALTSKAYRKIRWIASDYSVETEMIARVGKKQLRFKQIPVKTIYNDMYRGITLIDGMKIFLSMLWLRVSR